MRALSARHLKGALYWPMLLPAFLLLLLGLHFLSGLVVPVGGVLRDGWHLKQLRGIAIGTVAAFVLVLIPYKTLLARAYLLYAANLLLLVLVLLVSTARNQSHRWISLGGFDLQPSEFMKLTLVVTLARFIRFRSSYKTFKGLGAPFLLTLLPMALILKQPDLGTALLCIPLLFCMLFVAGARNRHLLLILLLGALCIYPVYRWGLKGYQKSRVDGFLAQLGVLEVPEEEKLPEGVLEQSGNFQIEKSKQAIGQGGWTGAEMEEGGEAALRRVPERQTDFIFAVVATESGYLGSTLFILLYLALLGSILLIALRHRDPAGRLICVGVFSLFAFQGLVNIGMTVGVLPITGMTLPLISYGGSSMLVSLLSLALVCNVAARPSYEFGRGDFD